MHERKLGRVWGNVALFRATLLSALCVGAANTMLDAGIEMDPDSGQAR